MWLDAPASRSNLGHSYAPNLVGSFPRAMLQTPDFNPLPLIRHLWSRKYIILLAPIVFLVLATVYFRTNMNDVYECSAVLRIRPEPSQLMNGRAFQNFEPPVYQDIFLAPSLLKEVVDDARQEFADFPKTNFESLKNRFDVSIVRTRETVVVSEYSPVFQLKVESPTAEQAYFLLENWLNKSLDRFGQMRAGEALEIRKEFQAAYDELNGHADTFQAREAELQQQLLHINQLMAARYQELKGVGASISLTGERNTDEANGGLFGERTRLRLDIAEAQAANESDRVSRLTARATAVDESIEAVLAEIDTMSQQKVTITRELESSRERLLLLREEVENVRQILASTKPESITVEDPLNPGTRGDFSILSKPVKPETPVGPKRMLYSLGTTVFLSGLVLLLIIIEYYLRLALKPEDE